MEKIIHKKGKQTATKYGGFGHYVEVPSPICVGAKALYNGKSYFVAHFWRDVTCKHCLKKRPHNKTIQDIKS